MVSLESSVQYVPLLYAPHFEPFELAHGVVVVTAGILFRYDIFPFEPVRIFKVISKKHLPLFTKYPPSSMVHLLARTVSPVCIKG